MISRTKLKKIVSRNVRCLMREKHFYISTLNEKTGISRNTILNIRRGRFLPSFENAVRIAKALGVGLDDLIKEMENE
jgi:transcriptional regulator with XRE-family HTH domain